MLKVLVRRLLAAIPTLFLISVVAFLLVQLVPGDPARVVAGESASDEYVAQLRTQMGLDKPLITQYWDWITSVLHGDLGNSLFTPRPVSEMIRQAAAPTLSIAALALLIAVVLGVGTGVLAALRHERALDRLITVFVTLGISIPSFWLGVMLVTVFAIELSWLPATGFVPLADGPSQWLSHIILPAITLGLAGSAQISRQTRAAVIRARQEDYVRTATAKGAGTGRVLRSHLARNVAAPILTVIGLQLSFLIGGAVVVETVFAINGLGSLAVLSTRQHDFPVVQGIVLVAGVLVVALNTVVDISYGLLDPRVRDA